MLSSCGAAAAAPGPQLRRCFQLGWAGGKHIVLMNPQETTVSALDGRGWLDVRLAPASLAERGGGKRFEASWLQLPIHQILVMPTRALGQHCSQGHPWKLPSRHGIARQEQSRRLKHLHASSPKSWSQEISFWLGTGVDLTTFEDF